jgi:transposase
MRPLEAPGFSRGEYHKAIWNSDTREIAEYLYNEWLKKLDPEIKPFFHELTRATKNWWKYIFNYFEYPFTNAYTEAANGMIKDVQQAGRGYSFDVIRAKLVYGLVPENENEITPPDWW